MLASFLIGLVGGQRAMTPLAAVALAANRGQLPPGGAARLLEGGLPAAGALLLAAGEMVGDKWQGAPDRIVPSGLIGRFATSAFAGAVLAPAGRRRLGAALAAVTALAASYPGWRLRMGAQHRHGQALTGFVEDAMVIAAAGAIVRLPRRR